MNWKEQSTTEQSNGNLAKFEVTCNHQRWGGLYWNGISSSTPAVLERGRREGLSLFGAGLWLGEEEANHFKLPGESLGSVANSKWMGFNTFSSLPGVKWGHSGRSQHRGWSFCRPTHDSSVPGLSVHLYRGAPSQATWPWTQPAVPDWWYRVAGRTNRRYRKVRDSRSVSDGDADQTNQLAGPQAEMTVKSSQHERDFYLQTQNRMKNKCTSMWIKAPLSKSNWVFFVEKSKATALLKLWYKQKGNYDNVTYQNNLASIQERDRVPQWRTQEEASCSGGFWPLRVLGHFLLVFHRADRELDLNCIQTDLNTIQIEQMHRG